MPLIITNQYQYQYQYQYQFHIWQIEWLLTHSHLCAYAETAKNHKGLGDLFAEHFVFGKKTMAVAGVHRAADGKNWSFTLVNADRKPVEWLFDGEQFAKTEASPGTDVIYTINEYRRMRRYNPKIIDALNGEVDDIVFNGNEYKSRYIDAAGNVQTKFLK